MIGKALAVAGGALIGLAAMTPAQAGASVDPHRDGIGRYYVDCHDGGGVNADYSPALSVLAKNISIAGQGDISKCVGWDGDRPITAHAQGFR